MLSLVIRSAESLARGVPCFTSIYFCVFLPHSFPQHQTLLIFPSLPFPSLNIHPWTFAHTNNTQHIHTTYHTHTRNMEHAHTHTQNTHHTNLLTQNMLRRRLCSLPRYPDLAVREFAVDSLGRLPADELVHFLPQLIQVGIMWCNIYAQHINWHYMND